MEDYENARFAEENRRFLKIRMKRIRIRALASPTMEMLGGLATAAILYFGARACLPGA